MCGRNVGTVMFSNAEVGGRSGSHSSANMIACACACTTEPCLTSIQVYEATKGSGLVA